MTQTQPSNNSNLVNPDLPQAEEPLNSSNPTLNSTPNEKNSIKNVVIVVLSLTVIVLIILIGFLISSKPTVSQPSSTPEPSPTTLDNTPSNNPTPDAPSNSSISTATLLDNVQQVFSQYDSQYKKIDGKFWWQQESNLTFAFLGEGFRSSKSLVNSSFEEAESLVNKIETLITQADFKEVAFIPDLNSNHYYEAFFTSNDDSTLINIQINSSVQWGCTDVHSEEECTTLSIIFNLVDDYHSFIAKQAPILKAIPNEYRTSGFWFYGKEIVYPTQIDNYLVGAVSNGTIDPTAFIMEKTNNDTYSLIIIDHDNLPCEEIDALSTKVLNPSVVETFKKDISYQTGKRCELF